MQNKDHEGNGQVGLCRFTSQFQRFGRRFGRNYNLRFGGRMEKCQLNSK